ncbi:MAG: histidine--tRNA ligase [Patescibacteria group bacterium]
MSLSTQNYKGTRDFYPEDMRLRKWMFGKWREVMESFGYEEYDGPILEPLDLYTAKTSEEIVNDQSFNFTDRGGRRVVMRPEMTPTVSRMVAKRRQELGYPLRLYSIPNCFRYERQQRGRLREFWQLNADIFGIEGIGAEFEMMLIINKLMESFGATKDMYEIRVNSRELLNKRINESGVKTSVAEVTRLIDNIDKLAKEDFQTKLKDQVDQPEKLFGFLTNDGGTAEGDALIEKAKKAGVQNIKFVPTVARGFDYYTDIVFEVFDKNPENNRSMFGGGRYDGLVGEFGVEPVPTVGFGMGDVTFQNFLETNGLIQDLKTETDLYLIVVGDIADKVQDLAQKLRAKGLNVAVDLSGKKEDKQVKSAYKKNVANIVFVGDKELAEDSYKVRDLTTKNEEYKTFDEIVELAG